MSGYALKLVCPVGLLSQRILRKEFPEHKMQHELTSPVSCCLQYAGLVRGLWRGWIPICLIPAVSALRDASFMLVCVCKIRLSWRAFKFQGIWVLSPPLTSTDAFISDSDIIAMHLALQSFCIITCGKRAKRCLKYKLGIFFGMWEMWNIYQGLITLFSVGAHTIP